MPTTNKKIIIYAPADLAEWLDSESARSGVPVTELGRRALTAFRYATVGEANFIFEDGSVKQFKPEHKEFKPTCEYRSPVLIAK